MQTTGVIFLLLTKPNRGAKKSKIATKISSTLDVLKRNRVKIVLVVK
jgi:hypothetical protein